MFWLKSKHAHPDIVAPSGTFNLLAQAGLGLVARVRAQDGQHQLLEQGKVLCRVVLSRLAGILAEGDIEYPMQLILDRPMRPGRLR